VSKLFDEAKRAQFRPNERTQGRELQELDVAQLLENIDEVPAAKDVAPEVAPVVAPVEEPRKVALVNRESRVTIVSGHANPIAVESYRALRTRLVNRQVKKKINSIMITSAVPGEGKTLTALNLALCYAQLPETRVLLVDADLRSCGLSAQFGNPEVAGVSELLAGEATPEEVVLGTEQKNLFFVAAGAKAGAPSSAERFGSSHWREFLAKNGELFSLILIDSPPVLAVADSEMIGASCEGLLVVVRALQTNREILHRLSGSIDKNKFLGVVYNGVPDSMNSLEHYGGSYRYLEGPSK
jgi:capsular exopolysaccharide synthesis family protein